jgi:hypothetical protein
MYLDNNFKQKYLKYKMKYLELKNSYLNIEMKGGDKPFLTNDNINLFNPAIDSQKLMEPYLNPVYGMYMCESGFITNSYYLYNTFKDIFVDKILELAKKIKKLSRPINDSVQPIPEFEKVNPIDIGRYIALLYICKNNKDFIHMNTSKDTLRVGPHVLNDPANKSILDEYTKTLKGYIDNNPAPLKTAFPITYKDCSNMSNSDFYIILYCLWWVSKNDEGIREYYNGINEVIGICNIILSWGKHPVNYEPIDLAYINPESNSFEKIALEITKKHFHKYEMQYPQHFCHLERDKTYPDCGEITARNLINLICFDPDINKFNIEILRKYGAIQELIDYYTMFNTFEKQSAVGTVQIYTQDLNAKDAWSRLIIYYANNNVQFKNNCGGSHKYELLDRMAADGTTTNFFQLIKNLLPAITKWEDLNTEPERFKIVSNDTDENGFGKIIIETKDYSTITIQCIRGHYNMNINKKRIKYNYEHLNIDQRFKINILLNKERAIKKISNFLWINWSSELLVKIINDVSIDIRLRKMLLDLSFTDKIKLDTRRQIHIDAKWDNGLSTYFVETVETFEENTKINEYTYKLNDLEFVKQLPQLTHLNCILLRVLHEIDLSPLSVSNVTSIGDNFLAGCNYLKEIDLSPLSKVTSIGDTFLFDCNKLKEIDLKPLSKLKSIGNSFLFKCYELTNINLATLSNVESIGDYFMNHCYKLKNIDLTSLSNITHIGNNFLDACSNLKNIVLPPFNIVRSIGDNFLSGCRELTEINLEPLSKVISIGNNFLSGCRELTEINLEPFSKVTSIGNNFLSGCRELTEINLEPLSKVTSIGNNFLYNCTKLQNIQLRPEFKLKLISVGDGFISGDGSIPIYISGDGSIKTHLDSLGLNGKPYINGKPIPEGESLNQHIFEEVKEVQVVE